MGRTTQTQVALYLSPEKAEWLRFTAETLGCKQQEILRAAIDRMLIELRHGAADFVMRADMAWLAKHWAAVKDVCPKADHPTAIREWCRENGHEPADDDPYTRKDDMCVCPWAYIPLGDMVAAVRDWLENRGGTLQRLQRDVAMLDEMLQRLRKLRSAPGMTEFTDREIPRVEAWRAALILVAAEQAAPTE